MSVAWPPRARHPRLVNQDTRIGQSEAFLWRAADEQNCGDGSRLTDAGGDDVGLDELHRVVNRESRGDRAAGELM